jgi:pseudouridine kinase
MTGYGKSPACESGSGDTSFVTVVGGANIDIHGTSDKALRPNDSNPGTVHVSAGGVGRNIAENLARLGVDCRLITAVGDDHHGRTLMRLSSKAGIDTQYVQEIAAAQTSTYLSVIDASGDMKVAIADMQIIDYLTPEKLQPYETMLQESSLIVLDTNLPNRTLAWLTDKFAEQTIFVDTVSTTKAPRIEQHLGSIHTLKTSAIEAEALTGLEARTEQQLQEVAAQLHAAGVDRAFITRGSRGVFYSTTDEQGTMKLEQKSRVVRNAGGAGDAFLAGLAYAWLEDQDLETTLRFALMAADLTLSDPATSSPALSLAAINMALETRNAN